MTNQHEAGQTDATPSQAFLALPEKLAHWALSDRRGRTGIAATMSAQALDRLYERMFPIAICQGHDAGSDPAP